MENKESKQLIKVYEDGLLQEYEVQIDRENLENIMHEIIMNCSAIKHREEISYDRYQCRNETIDYSSSIIELNYDSKDNWFGPMKFYYCDQYYAPKIVKVIDSILHGRIEDIKYLFDIDASCVSEEIINNINAQITTLISLLNNYLKDYQMDNIEKAFTILGEIDNITMPEKSVIEYYQEIYNCFQFYLINTLDTNDLNALVEQLGKDRAETIKTIALYIKEAEETDFKPITFGSILETDEFREKLNSIKNKQKVK